jgi:Ca2+-binding RTX toxin-like protein
MEQEEIVYPGSQLMNDYYNWHGHDMLFKDYMDNLNKIYGTENSETLYGTNAGDMLDGRAPDGGRGDMIIAGGGDDLIFLSDAGSGVIDSSPHDHDIVVTMFDYNNAQDHYGSKVEEVQLWYSGDLSIDMTGADWNTVLKGNGGDNTITGGSAYDYMLGDAGADVLLGAGGDDHLLGGGDNDIIDGGTGNDQISGGSGDDILTGGAGADSFEFYGLDSYQDDRITDFESGVDVIDIWDADMNSFSLTSTATGTEIAYGAGQTIFVDGDGVDDVSMSDIFFHESETVYL